MSNEFELKPAQQSAATPIQRACGTLTPPIQPPVDFRPKFVKAFFVFLVARRPEAKPSPHGGLTDVQQAAHSERPRHFTHHLARSPTAVVRTNVGVFIQNNSLLEGPSSRGAGKQLRRSMGSHSSEQLAGKRPLFGIYDGFDGSVARARSVRRSIGHAHRSRPRPRPGNVLASNFRWLAPIQGLVGLLSPP